MKNQSSLQFPTLNVLSGALKGQSVALTKPDNVIGRDPDCDVVLANYTRVSRRHARLWWDGNCFWVSDLGSTNGVSVNGTAIQTQSLLAGQTLQLGDFSAQLWLPNTANSGVNVHQTARKSPLRNKWGAVGAAVWLGLVVIGWWRSAHTVSNLRSDALEAALNTDAVPTVSPSITPPAATSPPINAAASPVTPGADGKISPDAITNGKAATVLIAQRSAQGFSLGSGFLVGDGRHIVTNRHVVVDDNGRAASCLLLFDAGTAQQSKMPIGVGQIRLAPPAADDNQFTDDLAVITLPEVRPGALPLGQPEQLIETDTLYALGFPLGVQTLTLDNQLPSVSVKAVSVERLQSGKIGGADAVTVLQLGGTITTGNSGGPVLNNRGEVVGVVSQGAEGTGMSYAIPVGFVKQLLGTG